MRSLLVPLLSLTTTVALAQGTPTAGEPHPIVALPDQITWGPPPPFLAEGAKVAVLEGDPKAAGPFTIRVRMPDRYRVAPHFHPGTEHVTVLKGTFKLGMGEKFDASALKRLPAGAFATTPPREAHFAETEGETIVQLHGIGPWGIVYLNPADDPRRRAP
jgi:quercetin dioxygenase-like cupin family protein